MAKPGRNDLCACGSGRKFKKCCASKTASARQGRVWMIVVGLAVGGALAKSDTQAATGGSALGTLGGAAIGGVVGNEMGERYDEKKGRK